MSKKINRFLGLRRKIVVIWLPDNKTISNYYFQILSKLKLVGKEKDVEKLRILYCSMKITGRIHLSGLWIKSMFWGSNWFPTNIIIQIRPRAFDIFGAMANHDLVREIGALGGEKRRDTGKPVLFRNCAN